MLYRSQSILVSKCQLLKQPLDLQAKLRLRTQAAIQAAIASEKCQ